MGDPWGIGGLRGGEAQYKVNRKKKIGQKISKIGEIEKKKSVKSDFFY